MRERGKKSKRGIKGEDGVIKKGKEGKRKWKDGKKMETGIKKGRIADGERREKNGKRM